MNDYFKTVTLGAFTWKNEERITLLFAGIRALWGGWVLLHFWLITLCLNFPVTLAIARLSPHAFYSRLYGDNFASALPSALQVELSGQNFSIDAFNALMIENGYGGKALLPMLGIAFCLTLIIQAVFYLCAAFFLGLSRMNAAPLPFKDRLALAVFSSTLPVLASALFGFALPTVHIIVFYFMVIFFIFQRSGFNTSYKEE